MAKESAVVTGHLRLHFNSIHGRGWFPVAALVQICNLCNPPVLLCLGKARLGDDHPQTLTIVNNLGMVLHAQGLLARAEFYFREALESSPGAQLPRFQGGCGQWIWSRTLKIMFISCRIFVG